MAQVLWVDHGFLKEQKIAACGSSLYLDYRLKYDCLVAMHQHAVLKVIAQATGQYHLLDITARNAPRPGQLAGSSGFLFQRR